MANIVLARRQRTEYSAAGKIKSREKKKKYYNNILYLRQNSNLIALHVFVQAVIHKNLTNKHHQTCVCTKGHTKNVTNQNHKRYQPTP